MMQLLWNVSQNANFGSLSKRMNLKIYKHLIGCNCYAMAKKKSQQAVDVIP